MSRKKDTDYLTISARIHAMENRMFTRERMDRMIDARDEGEALKVLSECGYGGADGVSGPGRRPLGRSGGRSPTPGLPKCFK